MTGRKNIRSNNEKRLIKLLNFMKVKFGEIEVCTLDDPEYPFLRTL